MKKILFGCGALLVLLILLIGVGFMVIRKTFRQVRAGMEEAQSQLAATDRDYAFKAPADGKLDEARLTVWIKVREALKAGDQARFASLSQGSSISARIRGFTELMPDTMKELATALRENKMSVKEYAWTSEQVSGALKSRAAEKDPKLADLAAMVEEPDPALTTSGQQRGNFRMRTERPQFAPLDSEDARPILELVKKHEGEIRKVAHPAFVDNFVMRRERTSPGGRPGRAGAPKSPATTATLEQK